MLDYLQNSDSAPLIIAIVISFAIAIMHFESLGFIANKIANSEHPIIIRFRNGLTMLMITFTHLASIFIYACVYYSMSNHLGMGTLIGQDSFDFYDFIYYSLIVYTSLGFGDIYPSGGLRILSGLETLNGLILVAWSATYTYVSMSKKWAEKDRARKRKQNNTNAK